MTTSPTSATDPATTGTSLVVKEVETLDRLVALGRAAHGVEVVDIAMPEKVNGLPSSIKAIVKHTDCGPKIEGLRPLFEAYATAPERRKGLASMATLQSFIDLVNRHKAAETSAIFAKTTWPKPRLEAVIDYHSTGSEPGFAAHRVEYVFPLTEEFKAWMAMDGTPMEQGAFAQFLEEHVAELTAPMDQETSTYEPLFKERFAKPYEIMALSRDLEIHVGHKIKRKERLQSGERSVVFESEHMTASGEAVDIPGIFMISVAAFIDGTPLRIPARLRYRTSGGDLVWYYQLYRPEFWLRVQVQNDLLTAATETSLPSFEGAPEV